MNFDLRYALRRLIRARGFTLAASLTIALGVGANTAIFSLVNALLLRPPVAVTEPERLVGAFTSDYSGPPFGASSFADANVLSRVWRDAEVAARHALVMPEIGKEAYGRLLLGADAPLTIDV